jgi:alkanesulfonate monooxygenase SsuD/methylene tetrahydromethanopterin reductase-like flavin-dependent oxidoreductase (luciferase family)
MLDICEWGDEHGFSLTVLGEHHSAEDGYLPSPIVAAAAAAARTSKMHFRPILLTPFYDPIRLAEDLAVLDLISGGRIDPLFAAGYRSEEFELYGVDRRRRGELTDAAIELCKKAWAGHPFEHDGHEVRLTPQPLQKPRPPVLRGGSSAATARRAAAVADGFWPGEPSHWEAYREERRRLGTEVPPWRQEGPTFLYVTDDPERMRPILYPYVIHNLNTYASWSKDNLGFVTERQIPPNPEEFGRSGLVRIATPDDCVKIVDDLGDHGVLMLRPLSGGLEPELAWQSLELFAADVLPRLELTPSDQTLSALLRAGRG